MIVTEVGYKVAMYKEDKEESSITNQYIDMCEKTISHLITLIFTKKLEKNFSSKVLKDAIKIRNINIKRKEEND